jgi:hypothetical protein
MSDIFDDTISEVQSQKEAAAAAGATADNNSAVTTSEGQGASTADDVSDTQASDQPVESQETAGEGAREGEGAESVAATTEDQLVITGHENVEELAKRDGVAAKFMRRALPLVKQAGGMQMLRTGAEIVALGNDPATDGATFWKTVTTALGPSRSTELRNDIVFAAVDAYPDVIVRDLLGDETVTVGEMKAALADYRQWNGAGEQEGQAQAATDLSQLDPTLRQEIEELRELKKQFPELQKEVTGFRTERQTEQQRAKAKQIDELGQELYGSVFSVVTERINKLGLEPKTTDTPRVRGIKAALKDKLSQERLEAAFEANEDRKGISAKAIDKVGRLERDGAFAYLEALQVGAELTLKEVLESEEVKSLLEALKSELQTQSTPKDPSARPEMVAGAPAAQSPADRWKEMPRDVNPFDYGVSLVREKTGAAG